MEIFVAGATGVRGRPRVKALAAAGHTVRGAARGDEKAELVRSLGGSPISVDLFDAASVSIAVAGCDLIINLATKIPSLMKMRWKGAWKENDRLRRDASRLMGEAARRTGVPAYIQESITFMYADGGEEWLTEDSPLDAGWLALRSMMDAEKAIAQFTEAGGRGLSLRFAAFYAPYAQSTIDTARIARRRMFPVPGEGENYISSIHVDDAANAILAALELPAGVYNVADDEPLRMQEYAQAVSEALGAAKQRRVPPLLFRRIGGGPARYFLRSQRLSKKR